MFRKILSFFQLPINFNLPFHRFHLPPFPLHPISYFPRLLLPQFLLLNPPLYHFQSLCLLRHQSFLIFEQPFQVFWDLFGQLCFYVLDLCHKNLRLVLKLKSLNSTFFNSTFAVLNFGIIITMRC